MELTLIELTWLCQIIKTRKLAGFKLFEALTTQEADEVRKSLLEKGILAEDKLTDLGLSILEILSLYTNAKKFIRLGNGGIFANYQDQEYVLITEKDTIFSIHLVQQDMIVGMILSKFQTLSSVQDGEFKKRFLSKKRFTDFMEEHDNSESLFYYKVDLDNKTDDKSVLFISDGYFQHYNAVSGELYMYPKTLVQQGIENIFHEEVV